MNPLKLLKGRRCVSLIHLGDTLLSSTEILYFSCPCYYVRVIRDGAFYYLVYVRFYRYKRQERTLMKVYRFSVATEYAEVRTIFHKMVDYYMLYHGFGHPIFL